MNSTASFLCSFVILRFGTSKSVKRNSPSFLNGLFAVFAMISSLLNHSIHSIHQPQAEFLHPAGSCSKGFPRSIPAPEDPRECFSCSQVRLSEVVALVPFQRAVYSLLHQQLYVSRMQSPTPDRTGFLTFSSLSPRLR